MGADRPEMAPRALDVSPRRAAAIAWANSAWSCTPIGRATVWRTLTIVWIGAVWGAWLSRSPIGSAGWARATVVATRMAQPARNALRVLAFNLFPPDLGMH